MKFEIIDNRELDLAGKGYKWVNEPLQFDRAVLNDIRRTRGENYAHSLSDDFLDGYSPICRGDDGELYSVLFDFGGDAPRPVFWSKVSMADVKRVLKCGELRAVMCAETRNKCFGRTVWEDLESGDLAVLINIPGSEILVDLYTFLEFHKFFNMLSDACAIKKKMFVYGTDDFVIARRIDDTAYGRGVWKSDDGTRYVVVMTAGGQYFMALVDFIANRQKIEHIERCCF